MAKIIKQPPKKQIDPEVRRQRAREYSLKRRYGITLEQYEEMLKKQDYKCYVCQRHKDEFKTNLCVDHSHETGAIRGLLCINCNKQIVGRVTNPELFKRAYEYLSQDTGWYVPKDMVKPKRRRRKRKKNG